MTDAAKDAVRTTGPAGLVWSVVVTVMPKPGINDPQGEAIRGGLRSLDHAGVISVRAGKSLRLRVEGESREAVEREAALMCDRLLANPVIETYEIHVEPAGDGEGSA
ncbi:MAG: phosphoribosylformylglycinamidine synthase subunit PurS [Chloroflexota bacterium]|nr:phosphoribosylformylglycinamidine synthase subunit PurS [Chloroflexota bacterium]